MTYVAAADRYDTMEYRRCGRSGLLLPVLSMGLWHNFGDDKPMDVQREILLRAFDVGITHFDLANNYGPPYGAAERNFGAHLRSDLGSRKYLTASLDQSLARMGLEYVDIFYSHRPDRDTPLEETVGALVRAVEQGKALYVGISSYSAHRTRAAESLLRAAGVPLLIHQPSYSMINRWIEESLLDTLGELGVGCIGFTALAQGMLTSRYLDGIPADSRAAAGKSLAPELLTDQALTNIRGLNRIAEGRGQTLAQMALAWALRDERMTSLVVGASSVAQLNDNVAALNNLHFTAEELAEIDRHAVESGIDLWREMSEV